MHWFKLFFEKKNQHGELFLLIYVFYLNKKVFILNYSGIGVPSSNLGQVRYIYVCANRIRNVCSS